MRPLCIVAAVLFAGAAAAQTPDTVPGPQNDPATCSALWQAIGLPRYVRGDERDATLVCHTKYVLSHNDAAKGPDWVIEHLTAAQVSGENRRPKMKFQPDPFLPPDKRAVDADYVKSGFDRGHQAPSGDFSENLDWMKESFYLSNIVPQVGAGFNRDIWAKLEDHVRKVVRARGELYVITGPVYPKGSDTITISASGNFCHNEIALAPPAKRSICGDKARCDDGVTVPSAMYKIVYDPAMGRVNAFLMPNINHRDAKNFADPLDYIKKFQVTVQTVERATDIEFFAALPASRRRPIERQCAAVMMH